MVGASQASVRSGGKSSSQKTARGSQRPKSSGSKAKSAGSKRKAATQPAPKKKKQRIESSDEEDEEDEDPEEWSEDEGGDGEDVDDSDDDSEDEDFMSLQDWLLLNKGKKDHKFEGPFKAWRVAGQFLFRAYDATVKYRKVWMVYASMKQAKFRDFERKKTITPEEYEKKYQKEYKAIETLKSLLPDFDRDIAPLEAKPSLFGVLGKKMSRAAGQARSNDCSKLRADGIEFIQRIYSGFFDENPWIKTINKVGAKEIYRGPRHALLLFLLLPPPVSARDTSSWETKWKSYRDKVLKGKIKLDGRQFPRFLYHDLQHDPNDEQWGLLNDDGVGVAIFKHIFLGPGSVHREAGEASKSKASIARMNNMEAVTPGSIAYVYLVYWWIISDISNWGHKTPFDRDYFYESIVSLFEGTDDPDETDDIWIKDTLAWWNSFTFGDMPKDIELIEPEPPSALERIKQQNKDKAAEKRAAEREERFAKEKEERMAKEREERITKERAAEKGKEVPVQLALKGAIATPPASSQQPSREPSPEPTPQTKPQAQDDDLDVNELANQSFSQASRYTA